MKDREMVNLISGYQELFKVTGNLVFATAYLYMKRTKNKIILPEIETKIGDEITL